MNGDRLVSDLRLQGRSREIRVEADIGRVRQMPRQPALATTDIENPLPRPNHLGDPPEFGPGEAGSSQEAMEVSAAVKIEIESLVSLQHRIEEAEPARRFPEGEARDASELSVCRNAESAVPQPADQPRADRLNAALRRKTGDRTEWDR